MTTNGNSNKRNKVERAGHLKWVPISLMRVSPLAQRELNTNRVAKMAAHFDLERLGFPTVSERGGHFYIIDGQHRVETCREIGYEDQQIQCWTYTGLTEEQEADMFLDLNDTLTVDAFSKFKVGIQAGRPEECDIDRIVRAQGLIVSRDKIDGAISAVGTLRRVYARDGANVLARSLGLIRDAYGDAGLEAAVIDGIGLLCSRYNGDLDIPKAVQRLSGALGGVAGLMNKAEVIRRQTGNAKAHCVAAAAVDIVNGGRGGKKLPSWWRDAA